MNPDSSLRCVWAVDLGNTSVKLARFSADGEIPPAADIVRIPHRSRAAEAWLGDVERLLADERDWPAAIVAVAAVHREAGELLIERLRRDPRRRVIPLLAADALVSIAVDEPGRVGVDRLMAATAADRLRTPSRGAVFVDVGTAITVNLLDELGAFGGGAILAGPQLALSALHHGTSALPALNEQLLRSLPSPLGRSTTAAMLSGAVWGAVGAVRELIGRLAADLRESPDVLVTGGGAQLVADGLKDLDRPVQIVPHLVLAGVSLAAQAKIRS
jgi:type III pantothenate kinase